MSGSESTRSTSDNHYVNVDVVHACNTCPAAAICRSQATLNCAVLCVVLEIKKAIYVDDGFPKYRLMESSAHSYGPVRSSHICDMSELTVTELAHT
jgi:hypothetical protein